MTDEEALAIFESGEGFEPTDELTPLGRIVAAAERRGAVSALRAAADDACGRWSVKPYVDDWLAARADAIERGRA